MLKIGLCIFASTAGIVPSRAIISCTSSSTRAMMSVFMISTESMSAWL